MYPTNSPRQVSSACLVVLALVLFSSCAQEKTPTYVLGTGGLGGNYQIAGHAISRVFLTDGETAGFDLRYETSAGSVANINALAAGEIQFGLAQADHQYQASNGLAQWQESGPQDQLRAVFSLYNESVTLLAGADSGIRTMADLSGKRVDIGLPGSGTRQNAIHALEAAGVAWETAIDARTEVLDDRLAMLMHSELDAFFYTVGHPNRDIRFATYSVRGARFVPLANIEALLVANPYYSRSFIRINQYPRADNDRDVETVGVRATLLASANVSADAVYALTRAVVENLDALAQDTPVLKDINPASLLDGLTAPIHPGALRYYQEIGLR